VEGCFTFRVVVEGEFQILLHLLLPDHLLDLPLSVDVEGVLVK
jgi:hypothetical protein